LYKLIQLFIEISALRKGPEDVPHYPIALWFSAGLYSTIIFVSMLIADSVSMAFAFTFYVLVFNAVFIYILLALFNKSERYVQTICAEFGASAVVALATLPTLIGFTIAQERSQDPSSILAISYLLIIIWSIVLDGFILSRALDKTRSVGILFSLSGFTFSAYLNQVLFP